MPRGASSYLHREQGESLQRATADTKTEANLISFRVKPISEQVFSGFHDTRGERILDHRA